MKNNIVLILLIALILLILSCGGPVGGYQIQVLLNGEKISFPEARIYVDRVDLFELEDGSIGYSVVGSETTENSYLLFTLVGGEKGKTPQFNMSWLASANDISEIAGRNFPAFSIKMYPKIEGYSVIADEAEYLASYNGETCYIIITITKVDMENKWINGIFNNIYVEKVGGSWRRMELREGRFGAVFTMSSSAIARMDEKAK